MRLKCAHQVPVSITTSHLLLCEYTSDCRSPGCSHLSRSHLQSRSQSPSVGKDMEHEPQAAIYHPLPHSAQTIFPLSSFSQPILLLRGDETVYNCMFSQLKEYIYPAAAFKPPVLHICTCMHSFHKLYYCHLQLHSSLASRTIMTVRVCTVFRPPGTPYLYGLGGPRCHSEFYTSDLAAETGASEVAHRPVPR